MSITVSFYNNKSDRNVRNKTLDSTGLTSLQGMSCEILQPYQIDRPRLILDYDSAIGRANYFSITESGRSYFMDAEPEILSGGRMVISGYTDVLSSFYDAYKENHIILTRVEDEFSVNSYLPDPLMALRADIEPDCVRFPSKPLLRNNQFILICSGGTT